MTDNIPEGDTGQGELRHALHAINNSLHVLCLQAELARLHLENGHVEEARAALDRALKERNNCGEALRSLQQLVHSLKV